MVHLRCKGNSSRGERCGGTTFPNNRRNPGATPGDLHRVEDSLGWQNRLIDKASVRFRLTAKI